MKKGFTLAEVLITLAIIGVVAALTIPSVIINAREQGNITAFKKAVSVLNSAISLSIAIDSAGPGSAVAVGTANGDNLLHQLVGKMNVISQGMTSNNTCVAGTAADTKGVGATGSADTTTCWITTADGMQFILPQASTFANLEYTIPTAMCYNTATKVVDNTKCQATNSQLQADESGWAMKNAGDKVAASAIGQTDSCSAAAPCFMIVDVNGANTPNKFTDDFSQTNITGKVTDRFVIAVTADGAVAASAFDKAVMAK